MEAVPQELTITTAIPSPDLCVDLRMDQHPTLVRSWKESTLDLDDCGSHFGYVQGGRATLATRNGTFEVNEGMYFCVPGALAVSGDGIGFIATRLSYYGFLHIGGPIEQTGRLRYIDGCTDSLLISPVVQGDPCLNLLHIPPATNQTTHNHPSLRAGIIVSGEGVCQTPEKTIPLLPGLVFVIPAGSLHSFRTDAEPLRVIAWHPDSDCGPTDEHHPMVNRTWIGGRPSNLKGASV